MAKLPFGKKSDDLISDVTDTEMEAESSGRGVFGDGVANPLYSLEASRLKGGRLFTPNKIAVWPDRIEEHEAHAIRKSGTQAIHFRQVAQVGIERGLAFTNITVESSGGHVIRLMGVPKDDADRVKSIIDDKVREANSAPTPQVAQSAPQLDIADQLSKLVALRDSGILTDEEFDTQKRRLLGT